MDHLLDSIFKVNLILKFNTTDIDHNQIINKIQLLNNFNLKTKTQKLLNFNADSIIDDLKDLIHNNEIFVFKDTHINISNETLICGPKYQIDAKEFETCNYRQTFEQIYQKIKIDKPKSSFIKSFLLSNYLEDKERADTFFLNKKYEDALSIYSKYRNHDEFSSYCTEFAIYCKLCLKKPHSFIFNFNESFIDSVYFKRLLYILGLSVDFTFLSYRFYLLSKLQDTPFLQFIGQILVKQDLYFRKGKEILYFNFPEIKKDYYDISWIRKGLSFNIKKANKRDTYCIKIINDGVFIHNNTITVDQYQVKILNIEYISFQEQESQNIDIEIFYTKVGTYKKPVKIISGTSEFIFNLQIYVIPFFSIYTKRDYRIRSMLYVTVESSIKDSFIIKTHEGFSESDGNIFNILKRQVLGVTSLVQVTPDISYTNDPVYTDLDYTQILPNDKTETSFTNKISIQTTCTDILYLYKQDNELYNEIYKVPLCELPVYSTKKYKVFILVFNTYIITQNTKLNMFVSNYNKSPIHLFVSSQNMNILDKDFYIKEECSALLEIRCILESKAIDLYIEVKDEEGFIEYESVIDIF